MRCPIPSAIREQLSQDPYMQKCATPNAWCGGRVEFHHAFSYAGKRQNEPWCIIPLCHIHHLNVASKTGVINEEIRKRIKHFGAESDFRMKYPRSKLLTEPAKGVPPTP